MLLDITPFLIPCFIAFAFTFKAPWPSGRLVEEVVLSAQLIGFFSSGVCVEAPNSDANNFRATGCKFGLLADVFCCCVGLPGRCWFVTRFLRLGVGEVDEEGKRKFWHETGARGVIRMGRRQS
jgi:hypothetical protein